MLLTEAQARHVTSSEFIGCCCCCYCWWCCSDPASLKLESLRRYQQLADKSTDCASCVVTSAPAAQVNTPAIQTSLFVQYVCMQQAKLARRARAWARLLRLVMGRCACHSPHLHHSNSLLRMLARYDAFARLLLSVATENVRISAFWNSDYACRPP